MGLIFAKSQQGHHYVIMGSEVWGRDKTLSDTFKRQDTNTQKSIRQQFCKKSALLEVQTCKKFSPSINDASHLDQDGFLYFLHLKQILTLLW